MKEHTQIPKLLDVWMHAALRFHFCEFAAPAMHAMSKVKAGQAPCSCSCCCVEVFCLGAYRMSTEAVLDSAVLLCAVWSSSVI